jgi:hypothetical protein
VTVGSISAVSAASAQAQSAPMATANLADPYAADIAEASQRFGIPERWIRAVMRVESHGRVRAVSPKDAIGLMQIMPDTWAGLRQRYRLGRDPYDRHDNTDDRSRISPVTDLSGLEPSFGWLLHGKPRGASLFVARTSSGPPR